MYTRILNGRAPVKPLVGDKIEAQQKWPACPIASEGFPRLRVGLILCGYPIWKKRFNRLWPHG